MQAATVSVFICEDSKDLRQLLRAWLGRDERIEVVGEAGNGEDALRGIAEHQPTVAMVDLSMPRSLGTGMVAAVRATSPVTKVLVLTGTHLDAARQAMQDADGFLLKPAPMPQLADIVCAVAAGTWTGGEL